jgi:hypothetical protein
MFLNNLSNRWILIILLLTVFICIKYTTCQNKIENYDGKISNMTITQCGTECTIGENCKGFSYKPASSTCYLSKTRILGEPTESAYNGEYSKLDMRCNKINPIDDIDFISDNTLTQNSVYVCSDGERNRSSEFQYANLGSSSLETADTVGASAGRGVPTKIGDTPITTQPLVVNYKLYDVKYIDPEINILKDLEPNWTKLVRQNDDEIRESQKENKLNVDGLTDTSNRSAYIESDMEYLGQYALPHQCVVNVPFYDCIQYCNNNEKCAGVEYNKSLIRSDGKNNHMYENVCCPKQVIKKIIPRRNQFNRGKFYVKTELDKIKGRDSIVLTRQDFQKPNGISDLKSTINDNPRFSLAMTDRKSPDIYQPSEQDLSNVKPITNFILPGDLDRVNYRKNINY